MDRDFLENYQQQEVAFCENLFTDDSFLISPLNDRLRMIYGAPIDKEVIYCETGGIENREIYPKDKSLVLTIFPYKERHLFEAHLGGIEKFVDYCESRANIMPILQNPLFYENLDHMRPFFERIKAPCYFIRGQFALATVKGETKPELVVRNKCPVLRSIARLMDHCAEAHKDWLEESIRDSTCWESRYRRIGAIGEAELFRLRHSLEYRYASVAYFLGEDVADEILAVFKKNVRFSSRIFLHIHVLFDHIIAHGFGSHFSVDRTTGEGKDFCSAKVPVFSRLERVLCEDVTLPIPRKTNEYYSQLVKYEHPLQGIRLDTLAEKDLAEVSSRIRRQFEAFRKRVEPIEKGREFTRIGFKCSLVIGGALLAKQEPAVAAILAMSGASQTQLDKIPEWLFDCSVGVLERLYKHNLGIFLLNGNWE